MTKGLEFLKIFNVTERIDFLINLGVSLEYKKANYKEVYITNDVDDIWVFRVLENTSSDYEYEEGVYLVEKESIDKSDLVNFIIKNIDEKNMELYRKEDILEYLNNSLA